MKECKFDFGFKLGVILRQEYYVVVVVVVTAEICPKAVFVEVARLTALGWIKILVVSV